VIFNSVHGIYMKFLRKGYWVKWRNKWGYSNRFNRRQAQRIEDIY